MMQMKRIAIQGERGSFHDIAAHTYFTDEQVELMCCATFEEVFFETFHYDEEKESLKTIKEKS